MNDSVAEKLQILQVAPAIATLSLFDGSVDAQFIINPESMSYDLRSNFSKLPVLHTSQPLVWWQQSEARVTFPEVKWYTTGNRRDLSATLDQLKAWTRPDDIDGRPKLLKFIWGEVNVPRCYLERLSYRVTQWRSGRPTKADGSIDLILAPEAPEPLYEDVTAELSPREQEQLANQVTDKANTNRDVADDLGFDGSQILTLDGIGAVFRDGQPTGLNARDILPDEAVPLLRSLGSPIRTTR